MNIQALKKDVDELRKLNEKYDLLEGERKEVDRKLKHLKNDYDEGKEGSLSSLPTICELLLLLLLLLSRVLSRTFLPLVY